MSSEEPFNINSVPKEIKSQPVAEKKAPGKKPAGLGAPPIGPTSTVDAYEKLLSSIPEFADFGKLFKVLLLLFLIMHGDVLCYLCVYIFNNTS